MAGCKKDEEIKWIVCAEAFGAEQEVAFGPFDTEKDALHYMGFAPVGDYAYHMMLVSPDDEPEAPPDLPGQGKLFNEESNDE